MLSEEEILIPHSTVSHFTSGLTTITTGSESVSHFTTTTTPFDTNLNSFLDHDNITDTSLTGHTIIGSTNNTTTTSAVTASTTLTHHALEEEVGSMVEHKDIISGSTNTTTGSTTTQQQNSTSFVRMQQFHENLQDEEEETVMVSNDLVLPDQEQEQPEVDQDDLDTLKRIADDFVKSLSQEALEIAKEIKKSQEDLVQGDDDDEQPEVVQVTSTTTTSMPTTVDIPTEPEVVLPEVIQATPIVPTFELQVTSDGADYSEIPDQFQFQTSFRTHFVANFDENEIGTNNIEEIQGNTNIINSHEDNANFEDKHHSASSTDRSSTTRSTTTSGSHQPSSGTGNAADACEDIWAGEDYSVDMLRKSKTTFSMKSHTNSSKTDSEHSISSDLKQLSSPHDQESNSTTTSGGGDQFHTAHGSSSRPSSSDVDAMLSAISGKSSSMTTTTEYETAPNSHADLSSGGHSGHSSSYHTAASTLSSKSFSDKSGNLASYEHSETSDTLIDVSIEHDRDGTGTPHGHEHELLDFEVDEIFQQEEELPAEVVLARKQITGSIITIDSSSTTTASSDQASTIIHHESSETIEFPLVAEPEVKIPEPEMVKSTTTAAAAMTESIISSTASEKAKTGSGEILSSIEELKKDDSPETEIEFQQKKRDSITRFVSFDTSNLETSSSISPTKPTAGTGGQKSFDSSDFESRPESELKDFESRPHSISEAMLRDTSIDLEETGSRPNSKVSNPEIHFRKNLEDPFQRPGSPEPPGSSPSSVADQNIIINDPNEIRKTEIAFSTHFTQVIEDEEEYVKIDDREYKIMTAVEQPEVVDDYTGSHQALRGTKSFDSGDPVVISASPPTHTKPLGEKIWLGSSDLNLEDLDSNLPIDKKLVYRTESEEVQDQELSSTTTSAGYNSKNFDESDDIWNESSACEPTELPNISDSGNNNNNEEMMNFAYNPPLDQIIEEEEEPEVGGATGSNTTSNSSVVVGKNLAGSPEFEKMHERLCLKLGEKTETGSHHSSLQEFETLEQQLYSGAGSRGSLGSADSLELAGPVHVQTGSSTGSIKSYKKARILNSETSSQGSSGSLQEFEQMEDACLAAENLEHKAKHQEIVLSEIEEGHESQISESESCETLSQGGSKSDDDSDEIAQRMQQIDEIIRQAQTNVETFHQQPHPLPVQDYMAHIMEASTDSLDGAAAANNIMVTSTDSLEEKILSSNGEDTMKISTDSIELSKKCPKNVQEIPAGGSDQAIMIASTDSLESGSTNTRATASMLSSYASSNTSETYVSDLDKSGHVWTSLDMSGRQQQQQYGHGGAALGKLMEVDETRITTSSHRVTYGFNVSEVILPHEEGGLASTIERTVEMPAEVTKIQFKGPDAEQKMQEYVQAYSGGQSLQEVESIDASGNVIHKTVIQYPDQSSSSSQSQNKP